MANKNNDDLMHKDRGEIKKAETNQKSKRNDKTNEKKNKDQDFKQESYGMPKPKSDVGHES